MTHSKPFTWVISRRWTIIGPDGVLRYATPEESKECENDLIMLNKAEHMRRFRYVLKTISTDYIFKHGIWDYLENVVPHKYTDNERFKILRYVAQKKYCELNLEFNIFIPYYIINLKSLIARQFISDQLRGYLKRKKRYAIIKVRKIGYYAKLAKNKTLKELQFHPKYMSNKLLDLDMESMFEEYGY